MESSFSEYRDKTEVVSDSDMEFIDNSLVEGIVTYSVKKKARSVFVAESEESTDDEDCENNATATQDIIAGVRSKEHDDHDTSTARRPSDAYTVVISSSDEGEASPEILPKRPPRMKLKQNESILNQRNKKRLMMFDSDTDNSIIKENKKNSKLRCLKDTPLKINNDNNIQNGDVSVEYGSNDDRIPLDEQGDESEEDNSDEGVNKDENDASSGREEESIEEDEETDEEDSSAENNDSENGDDKTVPIVKNSRIKLNFTESESSDEEIFRKISHKSQTGIGKEIDKKDTDLDSTDEESENIRTPFNKHTKKKRKNVLVSSSESDDNGSIKPVTSKKTQNQSLNKSKVYDRESILDEISNQRNSDNHSTVNKLKDNEEESDNSEPGSNNTNNEDDTDEGPDEDLMVMSRATRMSIMGVVPKGNDSDESDFIESDSSHRKSGDSTTDVIEPPGHLIDDPGERSAIATPVKVDENLHNDDNTSRLTCSPFSSPLGDVTNVASPIKKDAVINLDNYRPNILGNKDGMVKTNFISKIDDDVTIIDDKPEIIALSSDDEDPELEEKKSPRMKKSPGTGQSRSQKPKQEVEANKENTIKSYLLPPSYPNQIRYVTAKEREKQLNVLEGLRVDLANVQNLLEQMDLDTLPDGGQKLLERVSGLEAEIRRQGDMVANMVVAPETMKNNIKAEKKIATWDDIQKASNEVQPRMFGKQAMATHMAERNLILDSLRNLHESLGSCPQETELAKQPKNVKTKLMGHQLHALAWLKWRETQRPTGGILADDMGLGKTITMISLIASEKESNIDREDDEVIGNKPFGGTLVVCPASLMQQWENEVQKHCTPNALTVCLHHGAARTQRPHPLAAYDLVLTTYNIMQRDHEKNGVLMRVNWRRVILDEAHIVRNHKSATSTGVSALIARRRWCLTGTPVQNKDLDLFALLKFLKCTPFDELTMWKKWIDNKSLGGQERLNTVMSCILLRRTKQQLQAKGQLDCLPDRNLHQQHVTLTKAEMNVYQKVLVMSKTLFGQFLHQRAEKNADAAGFMEPGKDSEYTKMHKRMVALKGVKLVKSHEILVLLLRLRQVCCHCGLIGTALKDEAMQEMAPESGSNDLLDELNKLSLEDSKNKRKSAEKDQEDEKDDEEGESASVAEAIKSVVVKNDPVFDMSKPSSKIKAVMDCLNENVFVNKGDKAVVVSQWTGVLRLVEDQLRKANIKCVTLSGSVSVPARQALINAINDPYSPVKVMLLSLSAGGVGLNLCGANHLLLLDPHWNPQLEEQAKDRIYRVGQKKDVHIYRFMCVDTVEQSIRKLQEVKLELAENVLTGAKNTNASKLSIEDLKMLFNMG